MRYFLICMVLVLGLSACCAEPAAGTTVTTGPTEAQTAPHVTHEPQTIQPQTSEPQETEPVSLEPDAEPMTEARLNLLLWKLAADPDGWYSVIFGVDFQTADEVDGNRLFANGVPNESQPELSADERAWLEAASWEEDDFWLDIHRISRTEVLETLQTYLGLSEDQAAGVSMDEFTYLAQTDCYYNSRGDTNVYIPLLYSGYIRSDGTIAIYFTDNLPVSDAVPRPDRLAVLRVENGHFVVLSCVALPDNPAA
ncbi:MAG: hypothetical protein ACI3V3_05145 [Faecousia sp.]